MVSTPRDTSKVLYEGDWIQRRCHFIKGDNFCDFLFAVLHTNIFLLRGLPRLLISTHATPCCEKKIVGRSSGGGCAKSV